MWPIERTATSFTDDRASKKPKKSLALPCKFCCARPPTSDTIREYIDTG